MKLNIYYIFQSIYTIQICNVVLYYKIITLNLVMFSETAGVQD